MKARLPQGYSNGGGGNIQQIARQAQKMQGEMATATEALEQKEYTASSGGGAVTAIVTGKLEVKSIEMSRDIIDPDDTDMLSDLIIAAVNEAIRAANEEKEKVMSKISGGISIPGLF